MYKTLKRKTQIKNIQREKKRRYRRLFSLFSYKFLKRFMLINQNQKIPRPPVLFSKKKKKRLRLLKIFT